MKMPGLRIILSGLFAIAIHAHAASPSAKLVCHITYGGDTREIVALPVASPYEVNAVQIGSYFLFRAVVQDAPADIASIKLYVYGDTDAGPVLIHQVDHPYPPAVPRDPRHGFTGLNRVYEPIRDGELEYWCSWDSRRISVK